MKMMKLKIMKLKIIKLIFILLLSTVCLNAQISTSWAQGNGTETALVPEGFEFPDYSDSTGYGFPYFDYSYFDFAQNVGSGLGLGLGYVLNFGMGIAGSVLQLPLVQMILIQTIIQKLVGTGQRMPQPGQQQVVQQPNYSALFLKPLELLHHTPTHKVIIPAKDVPNFQELQAIITGNNSDDHCLFPPHGFIFEGPKDSGKSTALPTIISNTTGKKIYTLDLGELLTASMPTSLIIDSIFAELDKLSATEDIILFIDDLDLLQIPNLQVNLSKFDIRKRNLAQQLQEKISKITLLKRPIYVVGTSHHVNDLPSTLLNENCLSRVYPLSLPGETDRYFSFNQFLDELPKDQLHLTPEDFIRIAQETNGVSFKEIRAIIQKARNILKQHPEVQLDLSAFLKLLNAEDEITVK